jgi:hypothetical protein
MERVTAGRLVAIVSRGRRPLAEARRVAAGALQRLGALDLGSAFASHLVQQWRWLGEGPKA